nr:hypothetical protein Iba_chr12bCG21270 [Ipomoea batatas]
MAMTKNSGPIQLWLQFKEHNNITKIGSEEALYEPSVRENPGLALSYRSYRLSPFFPAIAASACVAEAAPALFDNCHRPLPLPRTSAVHHRGSSIYRFRLPPPPSTSDSTATTASHLCAGHQHLPSSQPRPTHRCNSSAFHTATPSTPTVIRKRHGTTVKKGADVAKQGGEAARRAANWISNTRLPPLRMMYV